MKSFIPVLVSIVLYITDAAVLVKNIKRAKTELTATETISAIKQMVPYYAKIILAPKTQISRKVKRFAKTKTACEFTVTGDVETQGLVNELKSQIEALKLDPPLEKCDERIARKSVLHLFNRIQRFYKESEWYANSKILPGLINMIYNIIVVDINPLRNVQQDKEDLLINILKTLVDSFNSITGDNSALVAKVENAILEVSEAMIGAFINGRVGYGLPGCPRFLQDVREIISKYKDTEDSFILALCNDGTTPKENVKSVIKYIRETMNE